METGIGGRAGTGRVARIPEGVWAPAAAGGLMLLAGALAVVFVQPLLFPSLGPTAFLQAHQARSKASGLYATLVGHGVGIASGYALVLLLSPPASTALFKTHELTAARMWASVAAVAITLFVQLLMRAYHPPAAATTLLITLGGFAVSWHAVVVIAVGVLVVGFAGEGLRRLRLAGSSGGGEATSLRAAPS
jgi:hypothetical protein